MMFRVVWLQRAVNDLAAVWTQADSARRRAITAATNAIDRELSEDPFRSSESRVGEERVLFTNPLGVLFQVDLVARTVRVEHV
jgi:hypothetical protein